MFANSTCFGDDLMKQLAQGAAALKEGAVVVTMTDPVPSSAFEVLEEVGPVRLDHVRECLVHVLVVQAVSTPTVNDFELALKVWDVTCLLW